MKKDKNIKNILINKKTIVSISVGVLIVFVFGVVSLLNKGTYSEETDVNLLAISCPNKIEKSDTTLECSVTLRSDSITVKGINFSYNSSENLEFSKFVPSSGWTAYTNDADGLVMVNLTGLSANAEIGTLTYNLLNTNVEEDVYEINIVDIEIGDGDDTVLNLNNVSSKTNILSDVNTLDSISLSNGTLNETFDKFSNTYTANISSSEVVVSVTPSNDKSVVSGNVGKLTLNYGTNNFEIVVTSESGIKNTYKLSIFREYEFNSDKYIYSKDDNYLYTGTDIEDDTIINNITIDEALNKNIENNKLVITVNNDILLNIDLLNIDIKTYNVNRKTITVNSDETMHDLISNITLSDSLTYRVFNENNQILNGTLLNGMVLKIYYGDVLLDEYNINVIDSEFGFTFDDDLSIDIDNKFINYIEIGTTVDDLFNKINTIGVEIQVNDSDGNEKDSSSKLATGDKLVILKDSSKIDGYVISVLGDGNGDGDIGLIELTQIRKVISGWVDPATNDKYTRTGVYYNAIDLDQSGKVGLIDLIRVRKLMVS